MHSLRAFACQAPLQQSGFRSSRRHQGATGVIKESMLDRGADCRVAFFIQLIHVVQSVRNLPQL